MKISSRSSLFAQPRGEDYLSRFRRGYGGPIDIQVFTMRPGSSVKRHTSYLARIAHPKQNLVCQFDAPSNYICICGRGSAPGAYGGQSMQIQTFRYSTATRLIGTLIFALQGSSFFTVRWPTS